MRLKHAIPLLLLAPLCVREARAAGESITFPLGTEEVRAYLARPVNSHNAGGVILLHEWWGLNEQVMGFADRLERLGYVVVAPDLFRGKLAGDPGLARELMDSLDEPRAVTVVKGGIDYLRKLDRAPERPIVVIGIGVGGRIALASALQGAAVQAVVMFYGRVETTPEALAPLTVPLLGVFGGGDHTVPVADVRKFEAVMKGAGKDVTIIVYEGLGYGFLNDARPDYDPEMSKDSWERMRDWLAVKMPGGTAPIRPARIVPRTADRPPAAPGATPPPAAPPAAVPSPTPH